MTSNAVADTSPYRLILEEIRQRVRIGCTAEERSWPQVCTFQIEMQFDMRPAASSDQLEQTVDYVEILQLLRSMASDREWKLIESMSADICAEILKLHPIVQRVNVGVRKVIADNMLGVSCYFQLDRE